MSEAKKILEQIQNEERDRGKQVMFYLPESLAEEFKRFCKSKKVPASRVVAALITDWLADLSKRS